VVVPANTREEIEKEARMIISQELLRETEERYEQREEPREENVQKIEAGKVLEANSLRLVQKRLERLAHAEVPAGLSAEAVATTLPGAQPDSTDTFGIALERIIGKSDLIGVHYLDLGMIVSRSVGRIQVRTSTGQLQGYGTGFMVSPRLLLTNNHVLGSAGEASNSWVEFNYQDDTEGRLLSPVIFDLEPETFFLTDGHLDYSLVAVSDNAHDGGILQFGWNRLIEEQGKAIVGEYVNVVQHPNGEPKQLALRENQIVDELEDFLHYQTDTAPGSSGSPVFNDQWEVVALHHSGVPRKDEQDRILTREGIPWTRDMGEHRIDWVANEGARISRIVRHVKQQNLTADIQRRLRNEMFDAEPSQPLPNVRGPEESVLRPAIVENSQSPSLDGDGSAVWTLPLQVSVRLGQPSAPSANVSDLPVTPPPDLTSSATNTSIGVEPSSDRGEIPDDSQELREALSELEEARSRTYYDEQGDHRDREAYYEGLSESLDENHLFERLSELLRQTHSNQPRYQPSKYVYPWVDLHPNLKLQSVYSGREFSAEELIREDFRIDRERTARLQELFSTESALGAERVSQELAALEESLPYNCEHVVPQSWFGEREPMRGDLHHLFACESGCNSFRSNIPYFDFADFEEVVREACGKREANKFEPTSGKGAVARATLYFLLRYPGEINRTSQEYELDRLETLLSWHQSNPVTDYERHRNMAIFEQQGNRNPLIDFPEWEPKIEFRLGLG
jgi:endonuclease G, mitochondrial